MKFTGPFAILAAMGLDIPPRSALRQRAGALLVDGFFQTISRAGRLHPLANPARHGIEVVRDVPYRDTGRRAHLLDVYRPHATTGPLPIVLYVHGGGFRILSKDTHWAMGLGFSRAGYVVFNISYRLAPRHPFPAAIEDACAAFEWVVKNAERFGGDLGRLVLAGESAGANLVTSLALASSYERPEPFARAAFETGVTARAVVAACGILQVTDPDRFRRKKARLGAVVLDRIHEVTNAYLGGLRNDDGSLDLADPLVVLERGEKPVRPLPPFFACVGTRDPLLDDTRRLGVALSRLGVPYEIRYYHGELHAFHAAMLTRQARACWTSMLAFLDRHI